MDQQVPARLDHQLDAVAFATTMQRGSCRGAAGRTGCVAGRAPGGGAPARSDGHPDHAGNHDGALPPPGAARPGALTSLPGLLPGPGPTMGPRRAPSHHDPTGGVTLTSTQNEPTAVLGPRLPAAARRSM